MAAMLGRSEDPRGRLALLTAREREVVSLVADQRHNEEIAQILVISVRTVEVHVAHIIDKLGVADREEAGRCWRSAQQTQR
jgi:DNA-binding CsgD family transcriptional regulator